MSGLKVGKLSPISSRRKKEGSRTRKVWLCKCDCGTYVEIVENSLIKEKPTESCGCLQKRTPLAAAKKSKIGKRFGTLEVMGLDRVQNRKTLWKCKCSVCGITVVRHGCSLKDSSTCKCQRGDSDAPLKDLFAIYKRNAKVKGVPFWLNISDFGDLTKLNCFYCDIEPHRTHVTHKNAYVYNGLDRKTPRYGYVLENVVPCCMDCNFFKGPRTIEDFLKKIKQISKHMASL